MARKINDKYKEAAEEFARRVTAGLGDRIDSIVLYGSVARGQARRDSDIDILVISSKDKETINRIEDIRSDFEYERNFTFLISLIYYRREELYHLIALGSPFVKEVLKDGVILYNNGAFTTIRQQIPAIVRSGAE